jgi:3'-phosphoadenosine 5'-phosphosulfate sulfotransferase (PAPS reductase)/FAD synthetase
MAENKEDQETTVEMWPVDAVIPYERSLKIRSHLKVRAIADSIQLYGADQPLVVDKTGVIIKGAGRLEAMKMLGWSEIPVIVNTTLSDSEISIARIADNKVAESEWDKEYLWDEIEELTKIGIAPKAFGFDLKQLQAMYPDMLFDNFGEKEITIPEGSLSGDHTGEGEEDAYDEFAGEDPTKVLDAGAIFSFQGDKRWKRHLTILEYLNLYEDIILTFSGGADSIAALIWCINNGLKDKLYIIFSDVGWGVEHPKTYPFLKYIEEKAGIKIHCAGSTNPRHPGGFEDTLFQFAFPKTNNGCWIEREIRNVRLNALLKMENFKEGETVEIVNMRWAKSTANRIYFSDRGEIINSKYDFANPLATWEAVDVLKYIQQNGYKLPGQYLTQENSKCFLCPKNNLHTIISIRKKYPVLWLKILEYYSYGARLSGELAITVKRWLATLGHMDVDVEHFVSIYAPLVIKDKDLEPYLSSDCFGEVYNIEKHKLLQDELQGRPLFKSMQDDFMIEVCNGN